MRIVFAGSGTFGLPTLGALVEGGQEIVLAATQPDRPAGRGRAVRVGPVKRFAAIGAFGSFSPKTLIPAPPSAASATHGPTCFW